MSDLISKSEEREWVENWFVMNSRYHPYAKKNTIPIGELYDILERMPTIESVPVVLCKDCKHRPIDTGGHNYGQDLFFPDEDPVCPCYCGDHWYSWMPKDDWFCANGERNEDEAN